MIYLLYIFIFFFCMLQYFKIANYYNITDKPNERSSHSELTFRGGGGIFLVGGLIIGTLFPEYWLFIFGLFTIGVISFVDDRLNLSNKIRIFFHLVGVTLLFASLHLFEVLPWYVIAGLYVFVIGTINAYNFMDGINGITGVYSLSVLLGLQYANCYITQFIPPDFIWIPILACGVFLFFNFRKRARCFAGDVGSITIAFWILFLLLKLILETKDISYLFFLLVYGLDSGTTIFFRLVRGENIFLAHRSHFYQYLANEMGFSHLYVSSAYAFAQLIIMFLIIRFPTESYYRLFLLALVSCILFVGLRFSLEGKMRLLQGKKSRID